MQSPLLQTSRDAPSAYAARPSTSAAAPDASSSSRQTPGSSLSLDAWQDDDGPGEETQELESAEEYVRRKKEERERKAREEREAMKATDKENERKEMLSDFVKGGQFQTAMLLAKTDDEERQICQETLDMASSSKSASSLFPLASSNANRSSASTSHSVGPRPPPRMSLQEYLDTYAEPPSVSSANQPSTSQSLNTGPSFPPRSSLQKYLDSFAERPHPTSTSSATFAPRAPACPFPKRSGVRWTTREEETLRRMKAEGKTFREIAKELDRPSGGVEQRWNNHRLSWEVQGLVPPLPSASSWKPPPQPASTSSPLSSASSQRPAVPFAPADPDPTGGPAAAPKKGGRKGWSWQYFPELDESRAPQSTGNISAAGSSSSAVKGVAAPPAESTSRPSSSKIRSSLPTTSSARARAASSLLDRTLASSTTSTSAVRLSRGMKRKSLGVIDLVDSSDEEEKDEEKEPARRHSVGGVSTFVLPKPKEKSAPAPTSSTSASIQSHPVTSPSSLSSASSSTSRPAVVFHPSDPEPLSSISRPRGNAGWSAASFDDDEDSRKWSAFRRSSTGKVGSRLFGQALKKSVDSPSASASAARLSDQTRELFASKSSTALPATSSARAASTSRLSASPSLVNDNDILEQSAKLAAAARGAGLRWREEQRKLQEKCKAKSQWERLAEKAEGQGKGKEREERWVLPSSEQEKSRPASPPTCATFIARTVEASDRIHADTALASATTPAAAAAIAASTARLPPSPPSSSPAVLRSASASTATAASPKRRRVDPLPALAASTQPPPRAVEEKKADPFARWGRVRKRMRAFTGAVGLDGEEEEE
ncbi:hypothetical protein JCM8097_008376 [Rhodosporidiobolus ruineniae]